MGRVVSPTPTPLSSGRVVPALVASYDMHGRAVGLFYTQPTGQQGGHLSTDFQSLVRLNQTVIPRSPAHKADSSPLANQGGLHNAVIATVTY